MVFRAALLTQTGCAMVRRLLAAILVLVTTTSGAQTTSDGLIQLSGPIIVGSVAPADTFVTLDASDWGSGAARPEDDLTSVIPTFRPLPLPADMTGWTTDNTTVANLSCTTDTTLTSVQTAINSLCSPNDDENTILVLPNCDMKDEDDNAIGGSLLIPSDCDGVLLQGQASTEISHITSAGFPTTASNEHNRSFIEFSGSTTSTLLDSCNWTAGYTIGTTTLTTDCDLASTGDNAWSVGSIVLVRVDDFNGGNDDSDNYFRISSINTAPSAADTITLDRPITMDYSPSGADPYTFNLTGQEIHLVERKNSGSSDTTTTGCSALDPGDTDCFAERVGFAGITLDTEAEARFIHGGTYGAIRNLTGFESWYDNITMTRGTAAKFSLGRRVSRQLIKDSWLTGPTWQTACYGPIKSISNADPTVITIDNTSAGCDASSATDNPGVYISTAVGGEAGLADNIHKITGMANSGTDMLITVDLDRSGESALGDAGYASVLDAFGQAGYYADGTQIHVVNTIHENIRTGFLIQNDEGAGIGQGNHGHALVYNYFYTELDEHCGRDIFFHGNPESSGHLFEGNVTTCSWGLAANSPANGSDPQSEGVNMVFFRNWLRDDGTGTAFNTQSNFTDICSERGTFCTSERGNVDAEAASQYWTFIANVADGLAVSASGFDYHNNPSLTFGFIDMYLGKNLWTTGSVDADFSSTNTTTERPDGKDVGGGLNVYGASADIDEATTFPAGWSGWTFPDSLYYNDSTDRTAHFSNSMPSWGCTESGSFPWVGVDVYDGTPQKIPAQIRYEGTTCTPP